jgi:hypothetical protein
MPLRWRRPRNRRFADVDIREHHMTQTSYQTAPLTDYSEDLRNRANVLFQLVEKRLAPSRVREYKGSFSVLEHSTDAPAAKIVIYEFGKGSINGPDPTMTKRGRERIKQKGQVPSSRWIGLAVLAIAAIAVYASVSGNQATDTRPASTLTNAHPATDTASFFCRDCIVTADADSWKELDSSFGPRGESTDRSELVLKHLFNSGKQWLSTQQDGFQKISYERMGVKGDRVMTVRFVSGGHQGQYALIDCNYCEQVLHRAE